MKSRAACVAILLLGVIGCGLKGPLYLPDHTGAVVTRPAAGAENTGATAPSQQPGATQRPGATQQPGAISGTGPDASATAEGATPATPKRNPGKDDDSSQK